MLYLDLETYSETPIGHGPHKYAEDCEVLLCGYKIDKAPATVWDVTTGKPMPEELRAALERVCRGEDRIVMHNGTNFDRLVMRSVFNIDIPVAQIYDTMVIAYQAALPGKLADLCTLFGLKGEEAKDKDGERLINLFSKPQPASRKLDRATRETHPEDWKHFVEYCRRDIVSMSILFDRLPKFNLTDEEEAYRITDAKINDRGFKVDLALARGAVALSEEANADINARASELTGGQIDSVTRRDALLKYIRRTYDVDLTSLRRDVIVRALDSGKLPEELCELLRLRLEGTKTSVAKYVTLLNATSSDGRLRGTLQFRGASRTGRYSGRIFQPQNLPRPSVKDPDTIEAMIASIKDDTAPFLFENLNTVMSDCIRGAIIAADGKKFTVADYSNIEGRVLAWLAGEDWKLQAFRDADAGRGADLYKLAYGRTFGKDPAKVTKSERQVGKVLELAMGYGGGAGAFATFAKAFNIDLDEMAVNVRRTIDPAIWADASDSFEWFAETARRLELRKNTFIACDAVKRAWRTANSRIASLWGEVERACTTVLTTGTPVRLAHGIEVSLNRRWLLIRLPSGRSLVYAQPRLPEERECTFSYMNLDQMTRKWVRTKTYGGKLVENITQAVACDILCHALVGLEGKGYKPVTSIHDEVICEVPDTDYFTVGEMERIMTDAAPWAHGIPLNAEGFEAKRYRKD